MGKKEKKIEKWSGVCVLRREVELETWWQMEEMLSFPSRVSRMVYNSLEFMLI